MEAQFGYGGNFRLPAGFRSPELNQDVGDMLSSGRRPGSRALDSGSGGCKNPWGRFEDCLCTSSVEPSSDWFVFIPFWQE